MLVAGEREQSAAIAALNSAGIGATRSYPASIADVAGAAEPTWPTRGRSQPVAAEIARRIVTLPTHPLVGAADIRRMRIILEGRGVQRRSCEGHGVSVEQDIVRPPEACR